MDRSASDEEILVECREILGLGQLDASDNFFAVGGNSLDAVEMCDALSKRLGRDVSMEIVLGAKDFGEMLRTLNAGERSGIDRARPDA